MLREMSSRPKFPGSVGSAFFKGRTRVAIMIPDRASIVFLEMTSNQGRISKRDSSNTKALVV